MVQSAYSAIKALQIAHAAGHRGHVKYDALLFPSEADSDKPVEIRKAWETVLKKAKIEDFRFHDLRHTAASYLAMEGATDEAAGRVLACDLA